MPSGEVLAKANNSKPTIAKIFKGFHMGKIFSVAAEINEPRRWRPQGINTWEFRIHAIERKNPEEDSLLFSEYEAKAVLLGMNGIPNNLPEELTYEFNGVKNEIKIYFNARGKFTIGYTEHLTL